MLASNGYVVWITFWNLLQRLEKADGLESERPEIGT